MEENKFSVEIVKSWPENLNIVDKMAFRTFTNGEKLSGDPTVLDVRAAANLHVVNPTASNPEYDVIAFMTDFGLYYTGSETVQDMAFEIIEAVLKEEKNIEIFTFRTAVKESVKNKGRKYLTLMLLGAATHAEIEAAKGTVN